MTGFIIGLCITAAIIAFAEIFKKIDLKFFASLSLAVIPFIYIGFSIDPYVSYTYHSGSLILLNVCVLGL